MYPVLEPVQAREFEAAMQEWVRELGAGGAVQPDSVKYFVSAYQGSASHRAVLTLLDLWWVITGRRQVASGAGAPRVARERRSLSG